MLLGRARCGGWTHGITEHLINVGVHGDTIVLLLWHKIVPVGQRLERIMKEDKSIALETGGIA